MFKHILVPVDGSDTSLAAIDKAAGLAKAFGAQVTAIFVIDPYPFTGVGADFAYGQDQYLNAAKAEASAAIENAAARLKQAGVDADWDARGMASIPRRRSGSHCARIRRSRRCI